MMKKSCKINIKPLSDNKIRMWLHKKTPEYRKYEKKLLELIPDELDLKNIKTSIHFTFWFSSKLSDASNPLKALCDIIWKKFEDRDDRLIYHLEVDKVIVPKGEEFIEFEIKYLD